MFLNVCQLCLDTAQLPLLLWEEHDDYIWGYEIALHDLTTTVWLMLNIATFIPTQTLYCIFCRIDLTSVIASGCVSQIYLWHTFWQILLELLTESKHNIADMQKTFLLSQSGKKCRTVLPEGSVSLDPLLPHICSNALAEIWSWTLSGECSAPPVINPVSWLWRHRRHRILNPSLKSSRWGCPGNCSLWMQ